MKLDDIFKDSKFNFLREINNEIIDNPDRDTEKIFEIEDEEVEEDYDEDFIEDEGSYHGCYNAIDILTSRFNLNTPKLAFSSVGKDCVYVINFEKNELLGNNYQISEITLGKNSCKFKIMPDNLLLDYLHKKIDSYSNSFLTKKDICFDLNIKMLDYTGVILDNYKLHNAIISAVSSSLSDERGIETEVELYFDFIEISE